MYGNGAPLSIDPAAFELPPKGATVHLIGICGTGMSPAARILLDAGYKVAGSDLRADPPTGPALAAWGIRVQLGYAAENLDPAPDLVVVGNAVTADHVEARVARERGIPLTHMPALIDRLLGDPAAADARRRLVVAGTHGKSTTTGITAWLLRAADLEPGWLIGATPRFGDSGRLGTGPFVFEGDEYNAAFFDREAKFFHYRPHSLAVTNIEFDHADLYADLAGIEAAFRALIERMPAGGRVVLASEAARLAAAAPTGVTVQTLDELGFRWNEQPGERGSRFELRGRSWELPLPGRHAAVDAALALELARDAGAEPEQLAAALPRYPGLQLRQERLYDRGGCLLLRDFGHHPTELEVTVRGLRQAWPEHALWLVFEPRSYTSRTARFQDRYREVLADCGAERIWIAPVHRPEALGEPPLDTERLVDELGPAARSVPLQTIGDEILAARRDCDTGRPLLITLFSNGSMDGLGERLTRELAA